MRTIKFRAWNKQEKKMIYLGEGGLGSLCWDLDVAGIDTKSEDENVIGMEWTGLKDKNGKDIYEGDIVTTFDGNKEVKFKSGGFRVLTSKNGSRLSQYHLSIEIIGNIMENKELLN